MMSMIRRLVGRRATITGTPDGDANLYAKYRAFMDEELAASLGGAGTDPLVQELARARVALDGYDEFVRTVSKLSRARRAEFVVMIEGGRGTWLREIARKAEALAASRPASDSRPESQGQALRVDPDCSASLEPFRERLAETVAWCASRVDPNSPRGCLRTPRLRDRVLNGSYRDCVSDVAYARTRLLLTTGREPIKGPAGGRLIAYFPDGDLSDGAAESESRGFFDSHNTPPWDTWVAFVSEPSHSSDHYSDYLIAWVPPAFVGLASAGIAVNPEECIRWLDESGVSFARLIESARRLRRFPPDAGPP